MLDKNYCMSAYLAFRYLENPEKNFKKGLTHKNFTPLDDSEKDVCVTADDIHCSIKHQMDELKSKYDRPGIMLSGGMDSAIVASYLSGCDAYTFRFLNGEYQSEELRRAEYYANYYGLILHYVDISWETIELYLEPCMRAKGSPVHSIEPQILQAAIQARSDGVDCMLIGESSDLVFGGMDGLLSKDWTFDEFIRRYIFLDPAMVLKEPVSMTYLFERYKTSNDMIDYQSFIR